MRPHLLAAATFCLAGCDGVQSALAPGGADAAAIATLSWVLFIGGGAILALVVGLTVHAMSGRAEGRPGAASSAFIIGGGVVFPVITLTALLVYGLSLTGSVGRSSEPPALRIEVAGEQFWWRVHYSDGAGAIASANEIHIPTGRTVELRLTSPDVIHSFWVPALAGKLDMIPGQENRMTIRAERPGVYRGQCAEYCGIQHAQMALYVVAHPATEFEQWLSAYRLPAAAAPASEEARQGRELFQRAGCGACHTVRGTQALGTIGPDLTHIGSRRSLAAGMLPNTPATLADWIGSGQHLKPGNRMPSFELLAGPERRSIAAYLESLK
jgi:cytochrome c oxidase subunit 2